MEAQYYVNLYRCMAKPLGSGISFWHKGEKFNVGKIKNGIKYGVAKYICNEGRIVNIENNTLWVKVKDSVIILAEIRKDDGKEVRLEKYFKNGQLLSDNGELYE